MNTIRTISLIGMGGGFCAGGATLMTSPGWPGEDRRVSVEKELVDDGVDRAPVTGRRISLMAIEPIDNLIAVAEGTTDRDGVVDLQLESLHVEDTMLQEFHLAVEQRDGDPRNHTAPLDFHSTELFQSSFLAVVDARLDQGDLRYAMYLLQAADPGSTLAQEGWGHVCPAVLQQAERHHRAKEYGELSSLVQGAPKEGECRDAWALADSAEAMADQQAKLDSPMFSWYRLGATIEEFPRLVYMGSMGKFDVYRDQVNPNGIAVDDGLRTESLLFLDGELQSIVLHGLSWSNAKAILKDLSDGYGEPRCLSEYECDWLGTSKAVHWEYLPGEGKCEVRVDWTGE